MADAIIRLPITQQPKRYAELIGGGLRLSGVAFSSTIAAAT